MTACRPRLTTMATSSQGLRHTGTLSSELSSLSAFMALLRGGGGAVGGRQGAGVNREGAAAQGWAGGHG